MSQNKNKKTGSLVLNRQAGDQIFILKDGKQIVDILIEETSTNAVRISIRSKEEVRILSKKGLPIYDLDTPH